MVKKYFFKNRFINLKATKFFLVAYILLNIFSSFFHLYSSKETPSKKEIYSKGEVIIYNGTYIENTSSTDSLNLIQLKGGAIIYNTLKKEVIVSQGEIRKPNKKKNAVKVYKPSAKKTYKKYNVNTYFKDIDSGLQITSLFIEHYVSTVIPQNSISKYAINNAGNTKNVQQVYQKQKIKNYYFSKEILNSFSKKYFGRPPPINLS